MLPGISAPPGPHAQTPREMQQGISAPRDTTARKEQQLQSPAWLEPSATQQEIQTPQIVCYVQPVSNILINPLSDKHKNS